MSTARMIQLAAQVTVKTLIVLTPGLLGLGVCALVGEPILIMAGQ